MRRRWWAGLVLAALSLGSLAAAAEYADIEVWSSRNPNKTRSFLNDRSYGFSPLTMDCVPVLEDADGPADPMDTSTDTITRWVPWYASGEDTTSYRAVYCKVVVRKGDGVFVRAFGPSSGSFGDIILSLSPDSVSAVLEIPSEVDSLWLWDVSGTSNACLFCF